MNVRRAGPGDEAVLRALRLEALSESPHAFASTLERERSRTDEEWRRWFSPGATFLLETPSGPAGLAAGVLHDRDPRAAFLMGMWVRPALRGTGAADALVVTVLGWASTRGFARVFLHVGRENARARRCYLRNGFRETGATFVNEHGLVEMEMVHRLGSPDTQ